MTLIYLIQNRAPANVPWRCDGSAVDLRNNVDASGVEGVVTEIAAKIIFLLLEIVVPAFGGAEGYQA